MTPLKDEAKWWEEPSRQIAKHVQRLRGEGRELL